MRKTKKCPACGYTISGNAAVCPNCNMEGLNLFFLNKEDYDRWVKMFLEPHIERLKVAEAEKDYGFKPVDTSVYGRWVENRPGAVPPPIEQGKYELTKMAKECELHGNYAKASELWKKNASICREQGKSDDAYITDHRSFLCRQRAICQRAEIPLDIFARLPEGTPYVEILQNTLTRMADKALSQDNRKQYVQCKLLNAKLCRVMGKSGDAMRLEESASRFVSIQRIRSSEYYFRHILGDDHFMKLVLEEHRKDLPA